MSGHPAFWIMVAAVSAPLLAEIPLGLRIPTVVIEVLLGILIGPQVLGLAHFDGFVATMFGFGMAMTLFMGGMELDLHAIRGRPLNLAIGGWVVSLALGFAAAVILHRLPQVHAPMLVGLGLCTTGLGVLIPILRDSGQLETMLGRMTLAVGALGELGPIVAMSLFLSGRYSTWQELGYLVVFLAMTVAAVLVGVRARPPKVLTFLSRQLHASTQLPVRLSLLVLAGMFLMAERLGFESVLGAFAAGMVIGQATRGEAAQSFRHKVEAVAFGWFYPFFFIGTGLKFNVAGLVADLTTMLLVPAFLLLFLFVRGLPVLVGYRGTLARRERLPLALSAAVPSLSIVVVLTEIGTRTHTMSSDVASAVVGAALLAVLLFPTFASALLGAKEVKSASGS